MSEILAINQDLLWDQRLTPALSAIDQHDKEMLIYFCKLSASMGSRQIGLMPRAGADILPFRNNLLPLIDCVMPAYNPSFDLSWDDVTDQRAKDFQDMVDQGHKLVVFWSGGIDSTCILVALLKNFDKHQLSSVRVACTSHGILENPTFYYNHILPNFQVVDTNWFVNHDMMSSDVICIEGYAADTLTMSMTPSLDVCMAMRNPEMLIMDWRRPDFLLHYLEKVTGSQKFARWYYEKTKISVESVNIPIETYFDFMWWIGFNCEYYSWALHNWFLCYRHLNITFEQSKEKNIGWYRTDSYQLWAMKNNGPMIKHGLDLGSLKKHPKQYIYDYDKNELYLRFKTKVNSPGRNYNITNPRIQQKPFAITDKFEILYLEKDLEKILQLMPTHIRS